jgi:hypothetical protein
MRRKRQIETGSLKKGNWVVSLVLYIKLSEVELQSDSTQTAFDFAQANPVGPMETTY